MGYTFDGPNRRIVLTAGTTSVDVRDLYSRWKDWVHAGNAKYLPFFDALGGDPIDPSAGTLIPTYLFLKDGARIRPQEANHTLSVVGGILLVEGGGDPFLDTVGNFRVRINYQQPVQAIGYNTGGGGGSSLTADQVWAHGTAQQLVAQAGEIHDAMALDPAIPVEHRESGITAGAIQINHTTAPDGTVTAQRA